MAHDRRERACSASKSRAFPWPSGNNAPRRCSTRSISANSPTTIRTSFGRHAPARRARAHAGGRSDRAAARRAVLGRRRADPHRPAARTCADAQARRQDRAAHHPRPARSRHPLRPRAGDEPPPRPHHRRNRDRSAEARRPDRSALRPEGQPVRGAADGPARTSATGRPNRRAPSHERKPDRRAGHRRQHRRADRIPGGMAMGAGPARHSDVHRTAAVDGDEQSCGCCRATR